MSSEGGDVDCVLSASVDVGDGDRDVSMFASEDTNTSCKRGEEVGEVLFSFIVSDLVRGARSNDKLDVGKGCSRISRYSIGSESVSSGSDSDTSCESSELDGGDDEGAKLSACGSDGLRGGER
jgi:hypothetical protein